MGNNMHTFWLHAATRNIDDNEQITRPLRRLHFGRRRRHTFHARAIWMGIILGLIILHAYG